MDAIHALHEAGISTDRLETESSLPGSARPDAILDVITHDGRVRFAVEEKRRAPYPNEIPRLDAMRKALTEQGQPLLVVPFVSESLGLAITGGGWSWADGQGNFDLRAPGLLLRQRRTMTPPKPRRRHLPQGSGSLAIIRALIRFSSNEDEEPSATSLAAQAKVSQPRVSQVLRQLQDLELVVKTERGRWIPDRPQLLDRFLAEYPGPRGTEWYCYSLESPTEVAVRAAAVATDGQLAVSADVGPDLVLAWRRPSIVILYAATEIDIADLGLVRAQGRHDANVIVRVSSDRSIIPLPAFVAEVEGIEVPLADPTQMIWDLQDLGGADRLEAAGMLSEWLLNRH